MIRQMLKLAVEAAKVEIDRWIAPAREPELVPIIDEVTVVKPPPPTKPATTKWHSTACHIEALGSTSCPDCGADKAKGSYFCKSCIATKKAS